MRTSLSAAALTLLAACQPAPAAEPDAPEAAALFGQLDSNKDGLLTADEIPDERKSLFERLVRIGDKNADARLTAEEFAAGLSGGSRPQNPAAAPSDRPEAGPGRFFARLDANGDGKIVLDEIPEQGRERFTKLLARADKDGDGAITREEFLRAGPPDGAPGKPAQPGSPGERPQAGRDPSQFFKRLDRNADGKVARDELPEERREVFERMIQRGDKDGDGALSLEEFTGVADRARKALDKNKPGKSAGNPAASGEGLPPGLFATLDADHDGRLSSAEIDAAAAAIRTLDADGDGAVSAREVMADMVRQRKKP